MKFPVEVLKEERNREKLLKVLEDKFCTTCIGRQFGMLGHGLTNTERGKILIEYANDLTKSEFKEPDVCSLCNNFFKDGINKVANNIVKRVGDLEFETFLIGSIVSHEMSRKQEEIWMKTGIEDVESIKSEINREVGKRLEKLTGRKFDLKNPDITIVADLNTDSIRLQIRGLYVYGRYQKLVRGIPQTKWVCRNCNEKGCKVCKGEGKLYKTSVQEIIEKPLLRAVKSKNSSFSGSGREDIDARCLDYRPFVIELIKPSKRKIDLKKIEREINKSKKVKVKGLKLVKEGKQLIRRIKTERIDKTYMAEVGFKQAVNKSKLKSIKGIMAEPILQKTPMRVVHRRADKYRKRLVKSVSYKLLDKRKLQLRIRAEAGLYIKELITGDEGRTKPNISDIIDNKVKKIKLDVIKIHTK